VNVSCIAPQLDARTRLFGSEGPFLIGPHSSGVAGEASSPFTTSCRRFARTRRAQARAAAGGRFHLKAKRPTLRLGPRWSARRSDGVANQCNRRRSPASCPGTSRRSSTKCVAPISRHRRALVASLELRSFARARASAPPKAESAASRTVTIKKKHRNTTGSALGLTSIRQTRAVALRFELHG